MPKRIEYLVHDIDDESQVIRSGQRNLLSYMGLIGCAVNKNLLRMIVEDHGDSMDISKGPMFTNRRGHLIIVEELLTYGE
jgi:hypothetical protein